MKLLGIDYGTKRIGLAVSDGVVAFPLTTIEGGRGAPARVAEVCKQEKIEQIVVGESRTLGGAANPVQADIEQFKDSIAGLSGLPIKYEREFFTSALAARQFAPAEKSRKKNPAHEELDASAAALLLQSYLDKLKK